MKISFKNENNSNEAKKARLVKSMVLITLLCVIAVLVSLVINSINNSKNKSSSINEQEVALRIKNNLSGGIAALTPKHTVNKYVAINENNEGIYLSYLDDSLNYISIYFKNVNIDNIYSNSNFYINTTNEIKIRGKNYLDPDLDLSVYQANILLQGGYKVAEQGHLSFIAQNSDGNFLSVYDAIFNVSSKTITNEGKISRVSHLDQPYYWSLLHYLCIGN